ncbi:FxsB family cyclophane-forming radical SAM/SPASM peptide maturase [Phytohabitans kaempferiae]|uniref:FxsB family cyclophane-forming radical SAM/SPASM peptide maturase n=1 Tax=Phytohabitans kaempferiae TaxID=1620943 RepID=A0ABV6M7E9_9ACTN
MRGITWRPTPFREFVLKVHSRCNLACDYCYMYELADKSWRGTNAVMGDDVLDAACRRIGVHATTHAIPALRIVLHGGEPMLLGATRLARVAERLRAAVPAATTVDVLVQTNGLLLTDAALATLAGAGIRVGVSFDGDRAATDRHRRYANGRSSYDAVDRALRRLRDRPAAFAGILSVVDLANDPVATYEALLAYEPPMVDFLLPHANWGSPPPGSSAGAGAPYGDWLVAAFDRWYGAPVRETRVRFFEEVLNLVLGGQSRTEVVGLSPVATLVFNVDGSYEQVDTLRSAYPGAVDTGLNAFAHDLDEVLLHPAIVDRQLGVVALSDTCRSCALHRVCGGGYYPHRYRPGSGFRNPSVYCADLGRLITHAAGRLRADVDRLRGRAKQPA